MKVRYRLTALALSAALVLPMLGTTAYGADNTGKTKKTKTVTLRIANWAEYLDEGDWDEEDTIKLPSGDIYGDEPMIDEFVDWYYENYGVKVKIVYSTYGSNEDLYNMMTLGDQYDLICPSEYLMMKLAGEGELQTFSDEFYDTSNELNYYARGLSPYIDQVFSEHEVDGVAWKDYIAGYMWGVTGLVYNPEKVSREDVSTWKVLNDSRFHRQVTEKDNVRDSYFATLGAIKSDLLLSDEFRSDPNYSENLEREMNDASSETIAEAQDYLQDVKDNVYSFESDAGKADMITGKVCINLQWSGDGAYTLDQAEKDGLTLEYAVPEEVTNLYFDGWVMLKDGINGNADKQQAAEAFVNYISRPDNVIRNMFFVGYTPCVSGGDDNRIFEYAQYRFEADEDETDVTEYPLGYFFSGDPDDENYVITAPTDQVYRQLYAQYPDAETLARSSIMVNFSGEEAEELNQMWINIRCLNIKDIPIWGWIVAVAIIAVAVGFLIKNKRRKY